MIKKESFLTVLMSLSYPQRLLNKSPATLPEYWPREERIIAVVKNAEIIFLNIVKLLIDLIHGNIFNF